MSYKYCFVPMCRNTVKNTPDKLFVTVPMQEPARTRWMKAVRRDLVREPISAKSKFHVCEDHFDVENDIENLGYVRMYKEQGKSVRVILKPGVLPSRFECQKPRSVTEYKGRSSMAQNKLDKRRVLAQLTVDPSQPSSPTTLDECPPVFDDIDMAIDASSSGCKVDFGVQVQCATLDKAVQARILRRSRAVQARQSLTSVLTSPIKLPHGGTQPAKKRKIDTVQEDPESSPSAELIEDTDMNSVVSLLSSCSVSTPSSGLLEFELICHRQTSCKVTMTNIERNPRLFLGLSNECYFTISVLCEYTTQIPRDIMITLKKIRLNHQFSVLAVDFALSEVHVSRVFRQTLAKISSELQRLIYWPKREDISMRLPIPFRKNYRHVVSIIDCFEIQIEKLSDPFKQSVTWSNYYSCNTIKYLVSCTPNGFVSFVSRGFGGRVTDTEIVLASGYLKNLIPNDWVMADRGFKTVSAHLDACNVKLVRPPSVSAGVTPPRDEVVMTKQIASLRVHVERVIGRLREFKFLTPHSTVDNKLLPLLDLVVMSVCGLVNMQALLL